MKKNRILTLALAVFLWALILFSLRACLSLGDRREDLSPHDFKGSEWQSREPRLDLKVLPDGEIKGTLLLDSEEVAVACSFERGTVRIVKERENIRDDDCLLEGSCVCTEQELVIRVKNDCCFGGRYKKIVLMRLPAPEDAGSP